jgi:hypothetical protein
VYTLLACTEVLVGDVHFMHTSKKEPTSVLMLEDQVYTVASFPLLAVTQLLHAVNSIRCSITPLPSSHDFFSSSKQSNRSLIEQYIAARECISLQLNSAERPHRHIVVCVNDKTNSRHVKVAICTAEGPHLTSIKGGMFLVINSIHQLSPSETLSTILQLYS